MMQSYVPTLCVVGIYLIMATTGPRIMAKREPFNVQLPMLLYNLGIVVLSVYMFYEVSHQIIIVRINLTDNCTYKVVWIIYYALSLNLLFYHLV